MSKARRTGERQQRHAGVKDRAMATALLHVSRPGMRSLPLALSNTTLTLHSIIALTETLISFVYLVHMMLVWL